MPSDDELMTAYIAGDVTAFSELFRRCAPQLAGFLGRGLQHDEVADLVQQTFLQLHRSRKDFRPGASLRPWLFTIAINVKRQHLRTKSRRREDLSGSVLESMAAPEPWAPTRDFDQLVPTLLARLPRDQRQAVELHFVEGLSFRRIAELVGATVGAVRVRAHRGYVNLRQFVGNVEDE
jgi:RNA polymerase sigma-70 factor (ECF subfamily)